MPLHPLAEPGEVGLVLLGATGGLGDDGGARGADDLDEGIVVDTHVNRVSNRLRLTTHADPEKIELDLMQLVPRHDWTDVAHLFISHGRAICKAPKPRCEICPLADICPSAALFLGAKPPARKGRRRTA